MKLMHKIYSIVLITRSITFCLNSSLNVRPRTSNIPASFLRHLAKRAHAPNHTAGGIFLRNTKSLQQPRLLAIDLSSLGQRGPEASTKFMPSLLGVDISALSRNPDPSLPMGKPDVEYDTAQHTKPLSSKMRDSFDSRYDRLPVLESEIVYHKPVKLPLRRVTTVAAFPLHHLPLNIVTSLQVIRKKQKDELNIKLNPDTNRPSDNSTEMADEELADEFLKRFRLLFSDHHNPVEEYN